MNGTGGGGPAYGTPHDTRERPPFSAARLWAGGVGTAVVVALIVVVGVLLVRGVLGFRVLAPEPEGVYGGGTTTTYALCAVAAALLATGLLNLLLVAMPEPLRFFGWIVGLATAAAALLPFTVGVGLPTAIATAVINALVGIAILSIMTSVAGSARGGAR